MDIAEIDWIPRGTTFGVDDMVFFHGKGDRDLDDVLGEIDLIVTGPHASGAFPEEMQPWVDTRLTRRLQYDFTDVSTSPLARRWASIDPHVLYIENPHPRAVRDANRPRPADIEAGLRESFGRVGAEPDGRPSLAGVDAIRPVTFGYLPVLRQPTDDADWSAMVDATRPVSPTAVSASRRSPTRPSRNCRRRPSRVATPRSSSSSPSPRSSCSGCSPISVRRSTAPTAVCPSR